LSSFPQNNGYWKMPQMYQHITKRNWSNTKYQMYMSIFIKILCILIKKTSTNLIYAYFTVYPITGKIE